MRRHTLGLVLAMLAASAVSAWPDPPTTSEASTPTVFSLPGEERPAGTLSRLRLENPLEISAFVEIFFYDEGGGLLGVEQRILDPGGSQELDLELLEPRARRVVVESDEGVVSRTMTVFAMSSGAQVSYPSASGIVLQQGSSYDLTWSGFSSNSVRIELYKGSALDRTISAATVNDGTFSWRVPTNQVAASDYRVKISATSGAAESDTSDNDFTIGTPARVSYPSAAGITWQNGSTQTITWSGFTGTRVRIELYKGAALTTTPSSSTPNDGSFAWSVPSSQTAGSDYRIRITSTSSSSQTDASDNDFTIGTPARVSYPSATGIALRAGSGYDLTWSGFTSSRVMIELYKGGSLDTVVSASTPNGGSFHWTVPSAQSAGSDYRIRITSTSNPAQTDISDNDFTISGTAQVTFPSVTGIAWATGSTQTITWSGFAGTRVRIELYKGTALATTVATSTPNDGSFAWTVPSSQATGSDYRIKLTSTSDAAQTDLSDEAFAIGSVAQVTYPSAADITWKKGETYVITWSGFAGARVEIKLYKGSSLKATLAASTPNDGSFAWTVPSSQTTGRNYRIRITSTADASETDISDNKLAILR